MAVSSMYTTVTYIQWHYMLQTHGTQVAIPGQALAASIALVVVISKGRILYVQYIHPVQSLPYRPLRTPHQQPKKSPPKREIVKILRQIY